MRLNFGNTTHKRQIISKSHHKAKLLCTAKTKLSKAKCDVVGESRNASTRTWTKNALITPSLHLFFPSHSAINKHAGQLQLSVGG